MRELDARGVCLFRVLYFLSLRDVSELRSILVMDVCAVRSVPSSLEIN